MIIERIYVPSIEQSNLINATKAKDIVRDAMIGFYEDCLIADNLAWQRNKANEEDGLPLEDRVHWKAVNEAILKRWSMASLTYIKKHAWRLFDEKCSDGHGRSEYS